VDGQRRERLWRLVADGVGRRRFAGWAGVVCEVVVKQVEVAGAAISLRTASRAQELVAATDDWAERLEELQYTMGEGPGVEAFAHGGPVLVADLAEEGTRWPGFTDAADAIGALAVFAFPVQEGAIRLGTLDLYHRATGGLSTDALADAAVLAELAMTALMTDAHTTDTASWTREMVPGHYEDVNVATGMLAAQLHISLDNAFLRLRAHAFSHDLPLLDVARDVMRRELRFDRS
jgi:hypothetical protein